MNLRVAEQIKPMVNKNTPVFTIINPVTIPFAKKVIFPENIFY